MERVWVSPMQLQYYLQHALSEIISEGLINCLIVTMEAMGSPSSIALRYAARFLPRLRSRAGQRHVSSASPASEEVYVKREGETDRVGATILPGARQGITGEQHVYIYQVR